MAQHNRSPYGVLLIDAMTSDARSPERLLALAVILRWVEDAQSDPTVVLGAEWIDVADVPRTWLLEAVAGE